VAAGFEVFGTSPPGPFVPELEALDVRHVAVASLIRHEMCAATHPPHARCWLLRRLRLDCSTSHTPKAGVLDRLLGRATGIRVIVIICHGMWARPATDGRGARQPPHRPGTQGGAQRRTGIPDYCVVDLTHDEIVLHRQRPGPRSPRSPATMTASCRPLPGVAVDVRDLLR
jgi:hypothetical protein